MSPFIDEEAETQSGHMTGQGLHKKRGAGISDPKAHVISTPTWWDISVGDVCLFILLSALSFGQGKFMYQMKNPDHLFPPFHVH